jgi:hypothetical protein
LNSGYKRGGAALRCEGESHEARFFDTYCPKALASLRDLPATLLDRCIVLTMQKAPQNVNLASSKTQHVQRVATPLRERIQAYAIRFRDVIARIYAGEPDCGYWPQLRNREAELWGPLLTHARLAGPEIEAEAARVAMGLSRAKAEVQAMDRNMILATELLDVLRSVRSSGQAKFSPGDLVDSLGKTEGWGEILEPKHSEKERAAVVGRFLYRFRLDSRARSHGHTSYATEEALEKIEGSLIATSGESAPSAPAAPEPVKTRVQSAADGVSPVSTPDERTAANIPRFFAAPPQMVQTVQTAQVALSAADRNNEESSTSADDLPRRSRFLSWLVERCIIRDRSASGIRGLWRDFAAQSGRSCSFEAFVAELGRCGFPLGPDGMVQRLVLAEDAAVVHSP